MSGLRVSTLRGETSGTSPSLPDGAVVTGVVTSTSFSGNLTGDATGNVVGNVTGDVAGNITGTAGTFSGNVSVSGTLTYDDVTNVDSVGIITARSGIKIGAGQSVSAVSGIATYYGDGSQLSGVEFGVSNFVASGTIANGATVVVNTDGTVSTITQTGSATPSAGTPVVFHSGGTPWNTSVYDPTNNKVVFVYQDAGNSDYGTAVVGTVSGTSISFGSEVVFESATVRSISATYDTTNNKVVIAYQDAGNSNRGTAIVGTVSGTSISFGSAVVFESGHTSYTTTVFDPVNEKIVIAYKDEGNSQHGTAVVGTVSGTSISFGTPVVFNASEVNYPSIAYDSNSDKVVICYQDNGNSNRGTAIIGTVSGTSISFAGETTFDSNTVYFPVPVFDSTNNKIVISYSTAGDSNYGNAIVGTVSGNSISFGSATRFTTATYQNHPGVYDSTNKKIVFVYKDTANSNYGTAIIGTVSGTSISFGTPVVFESGVTEYLNAIFDSTNNRVIIDYFDDGNSGSGTAVVFTVSSLATNLTSSNYTGIAAEAIADGATGKVNILGGVNIGQTGLTTAQTYYVQTNGPLSTTAGDPSVVAGTSISDTKILIRQ